MPLPRKPTRISYHVEVQDLIIVDDGLAITYQWESRYNRPNASPRSGRVSDKTFIAFRAGGRISLTKNANIHVIQNNQSTVYYVSKLDEDVIPERRSKLCSCADEVLRATSPDVSFGWRS